MAQAAENFSTLSTSRNEELFFARPFLKWVGGKGQSIPRLDANFPQSLNLKEIETYIEPFIGGGAVFFHIAQNYYVPRKIICDTNPDLIIAYRTVQKKPRQLANFLGELESEYLKLSERSRNEFYYRIRKSFNEKRLTTSRNLGRTCIERAAQLIFLNKTCFNGLFRVNSSGAFNVAFGKYDNPKICDSENLLRASKVLENAEILLGDFQQVLDYSNDRAFVYLDPPYRPLTETANFTGYSTEAFTQLDQLRLAKFCKALSDRKTLVLMSNSDPSNVDSDDNFFQRMYPGFKIKKTSASRSINCKADRRGKISELFLMNY